MAGQSCCYECLLDFVAPGERVVDSALVASEMVFFTTFIPDMSSACTAGGNAYLYAVDYLCRNLPMDPFGLGEGATSMRIGTGVPSNPILDSSRKFIFVQTSDGRIHRIPVNIPPPSLKDNWKEEN